MFKFMKAILILLFFAATVVPNGAMANFEDFDLNSTEMKQHLLLQNPEPVFPLMYSYWDRFTSEPVPVNGWIFSERNKRTIDTLFTKSMDRIAEFPHDKFRNFFTWSWQDDKLLENKSFQIYLTNSNDPILDDLCARKYVSPNTDSLTLFLKNEDDKDAPREGLIVLILLVDRIIFDETGEQTEDPLSRFMTALAYEMYGNVQYYLEYDLNYPPPEGFENTLPFKIKAQDEAVQFLKRFIDSPRYEILSDYMKEKFQKRLEVEVERLNFWKSAALK